MSIYPPTDTLPEREPGRVLFYNPGYEVSAARGIVRYTPPAQVRSLRSALAPLMYLLGKPGDRLWVEGQPVSHDEQIVPWGWAPEIYSLRERGRREDDYSPQEMHYFASRRRSYDLVRLMHRLFPKDFETLTLPLSRSRQEVGKGLERGRVVVKSEFSSSGRGLRVYDDICDIPLRSERVGGEEYFVEHLLERQRDRGYEFYRSSEGKIVYFGPSDFDTLSGRYVGNRLRPISVIEKEWQALPTYPDHRSYIDMLTEALTSLDLGAYQGYLGVDTIVYRDREERLRLHPCIEINVRPTMGHLALKITQLCEEEDFDGSLKIVSGNEKSLTAANGGADFLDLGEFPTVIGYGKYYLNRLERNTRFVARLDIRPTQYR